MLESRTGQPLFLPSGGLCLHTHKKRVFDSASLRGPSCGRYKLAASSQNYLALLFSLASNAVKNPKYRACPMNIDTSLHVPNSVFSRLIFFSLSRSLGSFLCQKLSNRHFHHIIWWSCLPHTCASLYIFEQYSTRLANWQLFNDNRSESNKGKKNSQFISTTLYRNVFQQILCPFHEKDSCRFF